MKPREQLVRVPHAIELRSGSRVVTRLVTCKQAGCTVTLLRSVGIESGVDAYGDELAYVGLGRYVHIKELLDNETICDNCGKHT